MKEKQWMAIYTKPRSEKKIAERLRNQGFEVYCPLQTTMKQWSDRKKKVQIPIFPSYVFVHISEINRLEVLQDPSVMNFVYYLGKPAIIRDEEIKLLKQFLDDEKMDSTITIHQFKKGDHVDIIAGPFQQQKGIVEFIDKSKITLLIESLGMLVKISTKLNYISK